MFHQFDLGSEVLIGKNSHFRIHEIENDQNFGDDHAGWQNIGA
jgi:hypothetical protein